MYELYSVDLAWLIIGEGNMFGVGDKVSNNKKNLFNVGDIVGLISGSKPMTIIQANPKEVTCTWSNANDDLQTTKFPIMAIKKISMSSTK